MSLADLISICMYVSDMDDYAQYNAEYNEFFESQPPVRVCVEASLPKSTPMLMIDAVAYSVQPGSDGSIRQCMHVQGISHWAPANIGPYSQAIWVRLNFCFTVCMYIWKNFQRWATSFTLLVKSV